ncbi:hypothetical protein EMCRGX_G012313 [Ephydatia muelleri]
MQGMKDQIKQNINSTIQSEEKTLCLEEEFGHVPVTAQKYLYPSEELEISWKTEFSSAPFAVITAWTGSAFQCPPTNLISLIQRSSGAIQPFTPVSCGSFSAVTTNVTSTCYTSVLTIPAVQALNGTTVGCQDGSSLELLWEVIL